jgi:DNA-binding NtrC family response regulator
MIGRLCLLVVGEQQFASHWLPDGGKVTLGQAANCDVRINEPSVAPAHAAIHVGPELSIEDLGSISGTWLGEKKLEPGRPVPLLPGTSVSLGKVSVVVQKSAPAPPRRIWTHGYFESRLEEECIRADRFRNQFSVLRIRCEPNGDPVVLEEILSNNLRLVDVIGSYQPGEYEVILHGTPPSGSELVARRILESLSGLGLRAQIGVACFPRDARNADALSERAGAAARGDAAEDPAPIAVASSGIDSPSGPMQHIYKLAERVAASTINVLILGETGVGKERLAERLHQLSPREKRPFVRLNVAALTETLLESELFGHERGAFTGAVQAKRGLLESADGGTVFLDEIGELPMPTQVKLLRVLEGQQVMRVGSLKPRSFNVRFIAATNRDLEAEVARGTFREDLFFRLNGISFVVPPLRERLSELDDLVYGFIVEACCKTNRTDTPTISPEALALMRLYGWPGNIRELRNVVERAVLLCSHGTITLEHLPVEKMRATFARRQIAQRPNPSAEVAPAEREVAAQGPVGSSPRTNGEPDVDSIDAVNEARPKGSTVDKVESTGPRTGLAPAAPTEKLSVGIQHFERDRIVEALSRCAGNQTEAAKLLGISRRTLVYRLRAYQIPRPRIGRRGSVQ